MANLNTPWRISDAHGLCIVGSDERIVADLTPRSDWMHPHDGDQLRFYAERIIQLANAGTEYDMSDSAIRAMVENKHYPEEKMPMSGSLAFISCEQCHNPWPCPAVVKHREWRVKSRG